MLTFICLFSLLLVVSSVMVLSSGSTVFSVLWVAIAFFNAAGVIMLLGFEFMAMMLVIIYIGAVAVLFLFSVMMIEFKQVKEKFFKRLMNAFLLIMLSCMMSGGIFLCVSNGNSSIDFNKTVQDYRINSIDAKSIGNILYSKYFYPFHLAGILLLLSMIAAVSVTIFQYRNRNALLYQDSCNQLYGKSSAKLVDVRFKKGVKF